MARKPKKAGTKGRSQLDRSAGEWIDGFLASLSVFPNVRYACRQVQIEPKTAYNRRDADPEFKEMWDEAKAKAVDSIEVLSWAAALGGDVRERQFMLKAHRAEIYGDRLKVKPEFPDQEEDEFTLVFDHPAGILTDNGEGPIDVPFTVNGKANGKPSTNGKE